MEDEKKSASPLWTYVGKLSAVVLLILGVFNLYRAIFPPGPTIRVICFEWPYEASPNVADQVRVLQRFRQPTYLLSLVTNSPSYRLSDSNINSRALVPISEAIRSAGTNDLGFGLQPFNSLWLFVIKNAGDRQAENLVLDLPFKGIALIKGQDGQSEAHKLNGTIRIDFLRPGKSASVECWSDAPPDRRFHDQIQLTHSAGVASIQFGKPLTDLIVERLPVSLLALLSVITIMSVGFFARDILNQWRSILKKPGEKSG